MANFYGMFASPDFFHSNRSAESDLYCTWFLDTQVSPRIHATEQNRTPPPLPFPLNKMIMFLFRSGPEAFDSASGPAVRSR